MKIHLCCGDIYLDGYENCDIDGTLSSGGSGIFRRTLDNYYQYRTIGHRRAVLVDKRLDVTVFPWDFEDSVADEVVMIQAIEHFTPSVATQIVAEIYRILKPNGKLLIDFPNIFATVNEYLYSDHNFMMRHVYGSHRDEYSVHHWGYTHETFKALLGDRWKCDFRDIVDHVYPVIGCEATKL